jgi:5-methylcytosine-specific restriction endonuclease McrA
MPQRALTPCKRQGCPALVRGYGYCPTHTHIGQEITRKPFEQLEERKTPAQRAFYSSAAWTETSRRHRAKEPLCRRCRTNGKIVSADMVHHNPPLEEILSQGRSPLADDVLESLCNNCHLGELRNKRGK